MPVSAAPKAAPTIADSAIGVSMTRSGPIGTALLPSLKMSGYSVTRLVRGKPSGEGQIAWNPLQPLAPESVSGFEAVIHLAGESVVGRWTEGKKRRILESRELGTRHLAESLAKTY